MGKYQKYNYYLRRVFFGKIKKKIERVKSNVSDYTFKYEKSWHVSPYL